MKCPFCYFDLSAVDIKKLCDGCLTKKGCIMIKCPNCSYETIPVKTDKEDEEKITKM
ncbi:MAG: hypothetical protein ACYSR1_06470 [Planctomycetota bacterium]|jgi:hypothetical protein